MCPELYNQLFLGSRVLLLAAAYPEGLGVSKPHSASGHPWGRTQARTCAHTQHAYVCSM